MLPALLAAVTFICFFGQDSRVLTNDEKYDAVFAAYKEACTMGVQPYRQWASEQRGQKSFYPNCIDAIGYGYYTDGLPLYYAYYDINGDGTDELFIAQDGNQSLTLLDAYTYHNDEVIKLFPDISLGDRANLYIKADGELLINGSSGADYPLAEYYVLPKDTCQPAFSHGYCPYEYVRKYPGYTPIYTTFWYTYVDTSGIQSEFPWNVLSME